MFDLYVYRFDKRTNSTSIPSDASGYLVENVKLKENTSILNPTFIVNKNTISTDSNYIKMEREGHKTRYYFIDDIIMCIGNIAEIKCTQDHLATWKTEIGDSTQMVLRSTSHITPTLLDNYITTTTETTVINETIPYKPFLYNSKETGAVINRGFYIIGILCEYACIVEDGHPNHSVLISDNIGRAGDIEYFCMTLSEIQNFISNIYEPTNTDAYYARIVSIKFVPISQYYILENGVECFVQLGGGLGGVQVRYSILNANMITNFTFKMGYSSDRYTYYAELPSHPQRTDDKLFLDFSPFSQYSIFCGEFGVIDINRQLFLDGVIYMTFDIDLITGDAFMNLHKTNPHTEFTTSIKIADANVFIDVMFSRSYVDIGKAISQISLFSTLVLHGDLSKIEKLASTKPNELYTKGGISSFRFSNYNWKSQGIFHNTIGYDIENYGNAYNQRIKINELSNFILCEHADLYLPATRTEIDAIKSYMNTGFFYN